jgi:hypothetical protein
VPGKDGAVWYPGAVFDLPFRGPWCLASPRSGFRCVSLDLPPHSFMGGETVGSSGRLDVFEVRPGSTNLDEITPGLRVIRHPVAASLVASSGGLIGTPDGDLWFGSETSITRVSPTFEVETKPGIGMGYDRSLQLITANGDFFYTGDELEGKELVGTMVRLTPGGSTTSIQLPSTDEEPIVGPEGDVWALGWSFLGGGPHTAGPGTLVRVSPNGSVRSFPLPRGSEARKYGFGLGGRLWSQQVDTGAISTISASGVVSPVSLPGGRWNLVGIGPHALWLSKPSAGRRGAPVELAQVVRTGSGLTPRQLRGEPR